MTTPPRTPSRTETLRIIETQTTSAEHLHHSSPPPPVTPAQAGIQTPVSPARNTPLGSGTHPAPLCHRPRRPLPSPPAPIRHPRAPPRRRESKPPSALARNNARAPVTVVPPTVLPAPYRHLYVAQVAKIGQSVLLAGVGIQTPVPPAPTPRDALQCVPPPIIPDQAPGNHPLPLQDGWCPPPRRRR